MEAILNVAISPCTKYLVGANQVGVVSIWAFEEILVEVLKSKDLTTQMGCFCPILKMRLQTGLITKIKFVHSQDKELLFCAGTRDIKIYKWSNIKAKIAEKMNIVSGELQKEMMMDQVLDLTQDFIDRITSDIKTDMEEEDLISFPSAFNDIIVTENKKLICVTDNGQVMIYNQDAQYFNQPPQQCIKIQKQIVSVGYKESTHQLIIATDKGQLIRTDLSQKELALKRFSSEKNELPINSATFIDGKDYFICGHVHGITKWDMDWTVPYFIFKPGHSRINQIYQCGRNIVACQDNNTVTQIELDGKVVSQLKCSSKGMHGFDFLQDQESGGKQSIQCFSGTSSFVDVFYNNYHLFSYIT